MKSIIILLGLFFSNIGFSTVATDNVCLAYTINDSSELTEWCLKGINRKGVGIWKRTRNFNYYGCMNSWEHTGGCNIVCDQKANQNRHLDLLIPECTQQDLF